jgi:hypothetical protein
MRKPERFTQKDAFSRAIERAVADYDRSRNGGRWEKSELEEIARSSAIAENLSYDGYQVDPAIVKAILAMSDPKLPKPYRAHTLDSAWKEYGKYA